MLKGPESNKTTRKIVYGENMHVALGNLLSFLGNDTIVAHNIRLNIGFIKAACNECGLTPPTNALIDIASIAREKLPNIKSHSINDISEHFRINNDVCIQAGRCYTIMKLYEKLQQY